MEKETKKGGSALAAAAIGRSATSQVRRHSDSQLASTGTNVSYEGATAPGAGGSVGTGYASGQSATGSAINTTSEYEDTLGARNAAQKEEDDLDEDTDEDFDDEDDDFDDDEDMDDDDDVQEELK